MVTEGFLFPAGPAGNEERPVGTGGAVDAVTPQPSLRGHTFSGLSEKVCKKRRWMRIGLYRGATASPRRRTLRPAHGNLSAKLNYSAACVETTLPSRIVAAHGDGKTRCRGNNRPPTHSPVVHSICILLYMFVGADGERSRQRRRSATDAAHPLRVHIGPFGNRQIRRRFS